MIISARRLAILSAALETAGIALMLFVVVSMSVEQDAAAQPVAPTAGTVKRQSFKETSIHGTPIYIDVPSLGISTPVKKGYYNASERRWTISDYTAFFATTTDEINNDSGSTLIYAHNSDELFGRLRSIKSDAKAIVRTANGYEFIYQLSGIENVYPTQTNKLEHEGKPRLILQTCTGWWNETRQLTYFNFVSYKKIK